ncbi:MAG: SMI1/KNR4 family protein [Anaerolineales bacterium]|nr:SMI1/KNR4 family protein [Anaerolineales bacterium]
MFNEIALLRQRLTQHGTLDVMHASHLWTVTFEWLQPAAKSQVETAEDLIGIALPKDYAEFLTNVSNGATLFKDIKYGQWGFKLYGTDEVVTKQQFWGINFPKTWNTRLLAFAETLGEANVLVLNLDRGSRDSSGCAVLEGNAIDPVSNWPTLSRTFHEWLDHLVTAQGDKYWEWK